MATMTTPTTDRSTRHAERTPSERPSTPVHDVGRALWSSSGPAWRTRDAFARGVIRAAVLSLEILAVAFVMGGVIGIARQVAAAGSLGDLVLPGLAIGVFAGLAALMCLALGSVFLLQIRMSRDLDELHRLRAEANGARTRGSDLRDRSGRPSAAA